MPGVCPGGMLKLRFDRYIILLFNLDAIIRDCMLLCETSMLLFVSACCYAKPRCYYSCLYAVMRNLDAIIRVRMLLCETSMLIFVSACCYAKPRCYYLCPHAVMRNLNAIMHRPLGVGDPRHMWGFWPLLPSPPSGIWLRISVSGWERLLFLHGGMRPSHVVPPTRPDFRFLRTFAPVATVHL